MGFFEKLFGKKKSAPDGAESVQSSAAGSPNNDTQPPKPSNAPHPAKENVPAPVAAALAKSTVPAVSGSSAGLQQSTPPKPPPPPVKVKTPAPVQKAKPAAPPNGNGAAAHAQQAGAGDFVDEIIAALDATFQPGQGGSGSQDLVFSPAAQDAAQNKESVDLLFAEIAATYAKPIRDFIAEVQKGTATKEWIEICRPALKSIGQAARSMQLSAAAQKMDELDVALHNALQSAEKKIAGPIRDNILQRYQKIVEAMPQAFTLEVEAPTGNKDGVIITSLLKQIPEVSRLTLEKLYSAGLTSMDTLMKATPKELTQTTGIQMKLAEQICAKVREYKEETQRKDEPKAQEKGQAQGLSPQVVAYRQRLQHLNAAMRRAHEAFERAPDEEHKRKLRSERKNCAFQISIVLAELAEVALVKELEKLTFERRIQTVDEYLARTGKK